jgi:hypothetical protein
VRAGDQTTKNRAPETDSDWQGPLDPRRTQYIGVYAVDPDSVVFDDDGLRFNFTGRVPLDID